MVDLLICAGANLGGPDIEGGFVDLEIKKAGLERSTSSKRMGEDNDSRPVGMALGLSKL